MGEKSVKIPSHELNCCSGFRSPLLKLYTVVSVVVSHYFSIALPQITTTWLAFLNSSVAAGYPIDAAAGLSLGPVLGVRPAMVEHPQVENQFNVDKT